MKSDGIIPYRNYCTRDFIFGVPRKILDNLYLYKHIAVRDIDIHTNARIKHYLDFEVVQVANTDMFVDGKFVPYKKKMVSVTPKGEAKNPERSKEVSRRRAKTAVRDISLLTKFTHMFTWTLNPELVDRENPDEVYRVMRNVLGNLSKRKKFLYVMIPEYHKDGKGIHAHGLCSLGDVKIVPSLKKNGQQRRTKKGQLLFNMQDWQFGWSTCVELDKDYTKAVSYITKYITKQDDKIFGKWYLSSRALQKKPYCASLYDVNYNEFRDEKLLECGEQYEADVYNDVKIISQEIYVGE